MSARTPAGVVAVYASGLLAGLTVVSFPASGNTLRALHGLSDADYGSLFLPQAGLTIVGSLVGAALAKRWGLRRLLVISLALFVLAEALLAGTLAIPSSLALPVLLAGTGAMGLGFGLSAAPLNTYPGLLFPHRKDPALVALHTLLASGFALGPLAVSGLVGAGLWVVFPLIVLGASVAVMLLTLRVPQPEDRASDGEDAAPAAPVRPLPLAVFGLLAVLYAVAEGTYSNWAAIYLEEDVNLSQSVALLSITGFWAALAVGRLLVSALVASVPAERVWLALPLGMIVVFLLLPYASGAVSGIGLFVLAGLAASAFFPLTVAIASARIPGREALVSSLLTAALMTGVGGGSYALGALRAALDFATLYRISALYPALALVLGFVALALTRRAPASE